MALANIKVPVTNEKGEYLYKGSSYVRTATEARDMVLNGDWLSLYESVERWYDYAAENRLLTPVKGTTGPNRDLVTKFLQHASLAKATKQLKSKGVPKYADMNLVQEKHPPTKDPMTQSEWENLRATGTLPQFRGSRSTIRRRASWRLGPGRAKTARTS